MSLSYTIENNNTVHVIKLKGKLMDKSGTLELMSEIENAIANQSVWFIFDLSALEYMTSTGLNFLVNVLTKARNADGEVVISGVSDALKRLFIITKLHTVFTIADDINQAHELVHASS